MVSITKWVAPNERIQSHLKSSLVKKGRKKKDFASDEASRSNYQVVGNVVRAQSCPTLCDSMDCSLPGSSVHGIFRARILESIALSYSRGSSRPASLRLMIGSWILHHCATWEAQVGSRELTAAEQWWLSLAPVLSCRLAAWKISADLFFLPH